MTNYADVVVRSSVENVQNLVNHTFGENGFKVGWAEATKGKAEKGSKRMNIAFGAFAQYNGIDFEILPAQDNVILRLYQANSGCAGDLLGASKGKRQFDNLTQTLAYRFLQQGVLVGPEKRKP